MCKYGTGPHLHRTGTMGRLLAVNRSVIFSIAYAKLLYVLQLQVSDVTCHSGDCCVYLKPAYINLPLGLAI